MHPAPESPPPPLPAARHQAHRAAIAAAVERVFAAGQFILGAESRAFEAEFAQFIGTKHGIGVASGTDALELALRACGIGPGHAVVTVSWTATATVAAIERAGATPVLVDIESDTFTMDPEELEKTLADYPKEPGRPPLKAILPVHLYGHPADLPAMARLARAHGLRLIEDCAQSHGAALDGRMTGTWGDLAAFSFYPTKNLGAFGDAGAVVTADDALAKRVHRLREYGWEPRQVSAEPGVNSRLDELQAAILRVLLPHLPAENLERQRLARRYDEVLAGTGLHPPPARDNARHAWHQYVIRTGDRDGLKAFLQARGIPTQIHYPVPVHRQPAYAGRLWHSPRGLPRTEAAAREVLSLPMSPHLPGEHIEHVLAALALWEKGRGRR